MAGSKLSNLRIAVVGGGIGGPALALLLRKAGCKPVVFEAAPRISDVGAGISLAPNGMRVMRSLGLDQKLSSEVGEPLTATCAYNYDDSLIVNVPQPEESYGGALIGFRRYRLRQCLFDELHKLDIPVHLGKRLRNIQQAESNSGPAILEFEDGTSSEADLVVGCDGLRSRVRGVVRGANEPPARYTGNEVVYAVMEERHHELVPPNIVKMVYGPGYKHAGAYGLGLDCAYFTVRRIAQPTVDSWGTVEGESEMLAVREELQREFEGWKALQQWLQHRTSVMIKVGIFDHDPVASWSQGVVTLLGDAASPIPPNLGQGGNKALEDAAVLAASLRRFDGDIPRALKLYEQLRIKRAADLLAYTRQVAAASGVNNPAAIWLRNTLLKVMVGVNGTIPADWLWAYDCEQAVREAVV